MRSKIALLLFVVGGAVWVLHDGQPVAPGIDKNPARATFVRESDPEAHPSGRDEGNVHGASTALAAASDVVMAQLRTAFASADVEQLVSAFNDLLPALIRADPARAGEFAVSLADPELRSQAIEFVAQLWALSEPDRACAWAASLLREEDREGALNSACLSYGNIDPAKAFALRKKTLADNLPSGVLETLVQNWAHRDFASALEAARGLNRGAQRDGLIARLAFLQASTSPVSAAALVHDEIRPGTFQEEAAIAVLNQWAQRDLVSASDWANRFPETRLRERALAEIRVASAAHVGLSTP